MAKLVTTDIQSQYASTTELNNNFALIEAALENTVSRDGTSPNTMSADIDLNSNNITNVNSIQVGGQSLLPDSVVAIDTASSVPNVAAGNIAATDVQAALNELDTEKVGLAGTETVTGDKTFSGTTTGVTKSIGDNSTELATTAYVDTSIPSKSEGSWSPTLTDGTNTAAGSANGYYIKIDDIVFFDCDIGTTNLGAVSGAIRIEGLPFTPAVHTPCSVGNAQNLAITAGHVVSAWVTTSDYIYLELWDATTGTSAMQESEWTADGFARFSGQYRV